MSGNQTGLILKMFLPPTSPPPPTSSSLMSFLVSYLSSILSMSHLSVNLSKSQTHTQKSQDSSFFPSLSFESWNHTKMAWLNQERVSQTHNKNHALPLQWAHGCVRSLQLQVVCLDITQASSPTLLRQLNYFFFLICFGEGINRKKEEKKEKLCIKWQELPWGFWGCYWYPFLWYRGLPHQDWGFSPQLKLVFIVFKPSVLLKAL